MIVLDASAVIDVILDQPSKSWVLDRLSATPICAPAHQPAEVLSAVARLVRAGDLGHDQARSALAEAASLDQELVTPTTRHLQQALSEMGRIRVLDGLYVVLAQARQVPLVTTDQRLARAQLPVPVLAP